MSTENKTENQSEIKYQIVAKDLQEDEVISIPMECGYYIISNKAAYISGGNCIDVLDGRIYELQKDNNPILSFRTKSDLSLHIEPDEMNCSSFRKKLSKFFTPYLESQENPEMVKWILKQFNREPADIPPWERTEPVRKINGMNLKTAEHSLNEERNATRFETECKPYLIYASDKECWYAWIVNHWEEAKDKLGLSTRFVSETILKELHHWEDRLTELSALIEGNEGTTAAAAMKAEHAELKRFVRAFQNHVNSSKSDRGMRAMLNICANSTMTVNLDKESDVNLLAFENGILDTKKGKLYTNAEAEQFKNVYPTRYINCSYIKEAVPQAFNWHLQTVFTDNTTPDISDEERVSRRIAVGRYFLRWLGYMLIAGNPEQVMIFFYGVGANGKSTTIDVLRDILGDEIAEASIKELYATSEDKPASGISNGLAARGLLFSEASDSDDKTYGGKISRDSIKALTGEMQTARFRKMRCGGVRQKIFCKPFAVTNELPHFDKEVDQALLRRIVTIPFAHKFTKEERDPEMFNKLQEEKDLIFSLMVDECIGYRKGGDKQGMKDPGLMPVPEFCKVTQADLLAGIQYSAFIDSMYEKTDGKRMEDRIMNEVINLSFMEWCDFNGIECDTIMKISGKTDQYGYPIKTRCLTKGESNRLYKAFRVKEFNEGNAHGKRYMCCRCKNTRTNVNSKLR